MEGDHYKRQAAVMGVVAMSMKTFSAKLIAAARAGDVLDDSKITQLKDECLLEIKNTPVSGLPITDETALLKQVIAILEQFINMAIADSHKI